MTSRRQNEGTTVSGITGVASRQTQAKAAEAYPPRFLPRAAEFVFSGREAGHMKKALRFTPEGLTNAAIKTALRWIRGQILNQLAGWALQLPHG